MSLEQLPEALALDPARLRAAASATTDYAEQLAERAETVERAPSAVAHERALRLASAYTLAASTWMLLDPRRAAPLFAIAADRHDAAGTGCGDVLRICAAPATAAVRSPFERSDAPGAQPLAVLLSLLHGASEDAAHARDHAATMSELSALHVPRGLPTGRLRIPFAAYLDLARELFALIGDEIADSAPELARLPATQAFLRSVGDATSVARANRYQWRTLRSGLLPVEPEAAATCALVELATRRRFGRSLVDVLDWSPFAREAAPAVVARELVRCEGKERDAGPGGEPG